MAKKAPTKVCSKCGKSSHARSIKCKHCHAAFPAKPKKSIPIKTMSSTSDILNTAIHLVKSAGSFEKAKGILNDLETIKKL
jgi:hypothetical protein